MAVEFLQYIEDFGVFVDKTLWESVKKGDSSALDELQKRIDGLVVYFHAYHSGSNDVDVPLESLINYGVIRSITIHTKGVGK